MIVVIDFEDKPPIVDMNYDGVLEEIRVKYKDKINQVLVVKTSAEAQTTQKLWRTRYDKRQQAKSTGN